MQRIIKPLALCLTLLVVALSLALNSWRKDVPSSGESGGETSLANASALPAAPAEENLLPTEQSHRSSSVQQTVAPANTGDCIATDYAQPTEEETFEEILIPTDGSLTTQPTGVIASIQDPVANQHDAPSVDSNLETTPPHSESAPSPPAPSNQPETGPLLAGPQETVPGTAGLQETNSQGPDLLLTDVPPIDVPLASIPPADLPLPSPSVDLPTYEVARVEPFQLQPPIDASVACRRVSVWPTPSSLVEQLEGFGEVPLASAWANQTRAILATLADHASLVGPGPDEVMQQLEAQLRECGQLIQQMPSSEPRRELARVYYSLAKRLDLWTKAQAASQADPFGAVADNTDHLITSIRQVATTIGQSPHAADWTRYLQLETLHRLAIEQSLESAEQRQTIARQVIDRLGDSELSRQQQAYLSQPPFTDLASDLRYWAHEPLSIVQLLSDMEQYETEVNTMAAAPVAEAVRLLLLSPSDPHRRLGEALQAHYRNANLRFSLTDEFINLMVPDVSPMSESVNDRILGAQVHGQSTSTAQLRIHLVPNNRRVQLGLEAEGSVDSRTRSFRGPVVFYNSGRANFRARKWLVIDPTGIRVWQSDTTANSRQQVNNISTDYDAVPILGQVIRNYACGEYDRQRQLVRSEMNHRVSQHAGQRLDEQVQGMVEQAHQRLEEVVLQPLEELNLDPIAVDMLTTEHAMTMRWRLSGVNQLGGFTSRPSPPAGSLLDIQIHHSAFNNLVQQLNLDGRQADLRELYAELAAQFSDREVTVPEEIPTGVTITFEEQESVRISCEENRLALTLHVEQLVHGSRRWNDFTIRAYYDPQIEGLGAWLARTESIEVGGSDLNLRERLALRSIFTKVLSRNHQIDIIHPRLAERTELAHLGVTQFELVNGWIGVAVGEEDTLADSEVVSLPGTTAH